MDSESSRKASADGKLRDVLLVYGASDDGKGYEVLRQRGDEIQAGRLRPLHDGKPLHGEVVRLEPRKESPALFDVEVRHDARVASGRPAQVATDEYRKGWESIWASKRESRELN
jgi:hypothetical protein